MTRDGTRERRWGSWVGEREESEREVCFGVSPAVAMALLIPLPHSHGSSHPWSSARSGPLRGFGPHYRTHMFTFTPAL